jgi:hypothetical protein
VGTEHAKNINCAGYTTARRHKSVAQTVHAHTRRHRRRRPASLWFPRAICSPSRSSAVAGRRPSGEGCESVLALAFSRKTPCRPLADEDAVSEPWGIAAPQTVNVNFSRQCAVGCRPVRMRRRIVSNAIQLSWYATLLQWDICVNVSKLRCTKLAQNCCIELMELQEITLMLMSTENSYNMF